MKKEKFLLLIGLVIIGGFILSNNPNKEENPYKNVTVHELKQMLDSNEDFFLLDVHIPEQEHIEGTDAFIPFDRIEQNLEKLPDKNTKIIVYCRSGRMSQIVAEKLSKLGYKDVSNLAGGVKEWDKAGYIRGSR